MQKQFDANVWHDYNNDFLKFVVYQKKNQFCFLFLLLFSFSIVILHLSINLFIFYCYFAFVNKFLSSYFTFSVTFCSICPSVHFSVADSFNPFYIPYTFFSSCCYTCSNQSTTQNCFYFSYRFSTFSLLHFLNFSILLTLFFCLLLSLI